MPALSIIMPVRNAEGLIGQSIESVLNQTFQDWELLIVDEASSDETGIVVKGYAGTDSRVQYVRREQAGTAKARNAALARIPLERPYIAFMEAGSVWRPEKLDLQLSQLQDSGADAVCCAVEGGPAVTAQRFKGEAGVPALIAMGDLSIGTLLCRRVLPESLGNFPEAPALKGVEGFAFLLKMLQQGHTLQTFPEVMTGNAEKAAEPASDPLTPIRLRIAALSSVRFRDTAAEAAVRTRVLELYRAQFDLLALRKDKAGIRSQLPVLNAFLGNPRIGSALANMLFLPSGLYRKFAHWLLSSLMK